MMSWMALASAREAVITHLVRQDPGWAREAACFDTGGGVGGLLGCPVGSSDQLHQVVGDYGRLQCCLGNQRGKGALWSADRILDRRQWSSGSYGLPRK